eukprot:CAMPEP_0179235612 /NCGR_PEP_ID=MMETSP0797-20121207/13502_1 /TAXON_ID=47934 /ORGANISM="Dinophysis acuminata, Strain DAEP01" /LENGTH=284 /DNA_ID=CAMNT_0020942843 /DNA_START=61 /DNA_END=915 /DNA_ORIENTATION=-
MGPVKFDDIHKVANEVLNDDYQIGYQIKAKQKTNWDGATVTTTVDVHPAKEPAKVSWKLPKVFGIAGFVVDKIEYDKKGMLKVETSADKGLHGVADLKLEAKSDLIDPAGATFGTTLGGLTAALTYTGIKDTQVKLDAKPLAAKPTFTLDLTRMVNKTTIGMKWGTANINMPDFGLRHQQGKVFASIYAKEGLKSLTAHGNYRVSDELQVACTYQHGGKQSGNFGVGLAYALQKGTLLKLKVLKDMNIQAGLKYEVAKGFTVLAGCKHDTKSGKQSFGVQVSIE